MRGAFVSAFLLILGTGCSGFGAGNPQEDATSNIEILFQVDGDEASIQSSQNFKTSGNTGINRPGSGEDGSLGFVNMVYKWCLTSIEFVSVHQNYLVEFENNHASLLQDGLNSQGFVDAGGLENIVEVVLHGRDQCTNFNQAISIQNGYGTHNLAQEFSVPVQGSNVVFDAVAKTVTLNLSNIAELFFYMQDEADFADIVNIAN